VRALGCGAMWRSERAERGVGSRPAWDSAGDTATAQPNREGERGLTGGPRS
jgi:hypothetical protein